MIGKDQLLEIESTIRRVLMSKGDPIGVSDVPEAADEYDSYIWGVYALLKRGADDKEIADHLLKIETERMGLTDLDGKPLVPAKFYEAIAAELRQILSQIKDDSPDTDSITSHEV